MTESDITRLEKQLNQNRQEISEINIHLGVAHTRMETINENMKDMRAHMKEIVDEIKIMNNMVKESQSTSNVKCIDHKNYFQKNFQMLEYQTSNLKQQIEDIEEKFLDEIGDLKPIVVEHQDYIKIAKALRWIFLFSLTVLAWAYSKEMSVFDLVTSLFSR